MKKIESMAKRHKIFTGFIFLAIAGMVYFGYAKIVQNKTQENEIQETAIIKKGDIKIVVTGTGQVFAKSQVDLQGVVAGDGIKVEKVLVKNDQTVKRGDLIVVLDTTEPKKEMQNAQLNLKSAFITQKETNRDFDKQTIEERWKRQAQEIIVQQKKLLLDDAKRKLEDYYIRAPFDGIVTGLDVEAGDSISRDDIVASVITEEMYAEISLNELDAARVKKGNNATIAFDALPGVVAKGKVEKIDTIGKITQNVVSYEAKIVFENNVELLKPGMSANAEIIIDSQENVLQIPNTAIRKNKDGTFYTQTVSSLESGAEGKTKTISKPIKIGISDEMVTQVVEGLQEGEEVTLKTSSSGKNGIDNKEKTSGGLFGGSFKIGGEKR